MRKSILGGSTRSEAGLGKGSSCGGGLGTFGGENQKKEKKRLMDFPHGLLLISGGVGL